MLGDNGAGKSTFIKILSGVHQHDAGEVLLDGEEVHFTSPRDALDRGIATVYQDLAMVPLMSIWRNFFLGDEPKRGIWPVRWVDMAKAKRVAKEEMAKMGIDVRDTEQPVGTLSGGERQSVAIARAVVLRRQGADPRRADVGARREAVGRRAALHRRGGRDRGLGVIFITHNPNHAYPVGDRFLILNRGRSLGNFAKERDQPGRADRVDGRRRRAAKSSSTSSVARLDDDRPPWSS